MSYITVPLLIDSLLSASSLNEDAKIELNSSTTWFLLDVPILNSPSFLKAQPVYLSKIGLRSLKIKMSSSIAKTFCTPQLSLK